LPSVLWHCWLGGRKSIWPVKYWVMRCCHGYLSAMKCKWFAYGPADATAPPPTISCFSKIQNGSAFLLLAYPGCPGQEAVKLIYEYKCSEWHRIVSSSISHWLCGRCFFYFSDTLFLVTNQFDVFLLLQSWKCVPSLILHSIVALEKFAQTSKFISIILCFACLQFCLLEVKVIWHFVCLLIFNSEQSQFLISPCGLGF